MKRAEEAGKNGDEMTRRSDWQTCRQNEKQLGEKKLFEVWRKLNGERKEKVLE